jgi:hypothetical protein
LPRSIRLISAMETPVAEDADARLSWIGSDDRGIEAEIVALDVGEMLCWSST